MGISSAPIATLFVTTVVVIVDVRVVLLLEVVVELDKRPKGFEANETVRLATEPHENADASA